MKKEKKQFDPNKEWWKIANLRAQQYEILKDYIQWIIYENDWKLWREIKERAKKTILDAEMHTLSEQKE